MLIELIKSKVKILIGINHNFPLGFVKRVFAMSKSVSSKNSPNVLEL
jgi:hypothetical protein